MYAQLKQMVEEEGIDDAYPVLLGHAQSMENYEKFKEACGDLIAGRTQLYGDIGCVVGAHAGPGIVGIAFIKKHESKQFSFQKTLCFFFLIS